MAKQHSVHRETSGAEGVAELQQSPNAPIAAEPEASRPDTANAAESSSAEQAPKPAEAPAGQNAPATGKRMRVEGPNGAVLELLVESGQVEDAVRAFNSQADLKGRVYPFDSLKITEI